MTRTEWRRKWDVAARAMCRQFSDKLTLPVAMVGMCEGGEPSECGVWWHNGVTPQAAVALLEAAAASIRKEYGVL